MRARYAVPGTRECAPSIVDAHRVGRISVSTRPDRDAVKTQIGARPRIVRAY